MWSVSYTHLDEKKYREQDRRPGIGTGAGGLFGARGLGGRGGAGGRRTADQMCIRDSPKPLAGQSGPVDLSSDTAKMQVSAGMNALKSGKVNMSQDKDVSFNVSGLDPEKAYDLYYVAQDKAGNYSARVQVITIHTLDPKMCIRDRHWEMFGAT